MENTDIRWKQRFDNFEKSFGYLKNALKIENPDIYQKAGIIHFFEMCFELSWKLMKDYHENQGFINISSPRESIKKSFETGVVSEGQQWLEALENRNLTAYSYDEEIANEVIEKIRSSYFSLLSELMVRLKKEL